MSRTWRTAGLVAALGAGLLLAVRLKAAMAADGELSTAWTGRAAASEHQDDCWAVQTTSSAESLRGLAVVDDQTVWASGAGGSVLRTIDGGDSWTVMQVPGAESLDFRDIEAWGANDCVVISAGRPGRIYRTDDGGQTWSLVLEDDRPEIFFDGMAFWDDQRGLAFGDPIDGRLVIVRTDDGGRTWTHAPPDQCPPVTPGQAGFAASGSSIAVWGEDEAWIGLGGGSADRPEAAIIWMTSDGGGSWRSVKTPLEATPSCGIFSLARIDDARAIAVGGDYQNPTDDRSCAALTDDGGQTWRQPARPPRGYRSAVAVWRPGDGYALVAVGTSGTDISSDGQTWRALGDQTFHVVDTDPTGRFLWAAGPEGRVARWQGTDQK